MDFRLSSEQEMLRDGARRFVGATLDFDSRAAANNEEQVHWNKIAELGWLMLPVPEAYEGLGGGIDDIAIISEELGRGLALEPYVEAGFLPAQLMTLAGTSAQCAAILPDLAMGTARVAVALYEPQAGFNLLSDKSQAERDGNDLRLSGTKVNIEGGTTATHILVSAALDNAPALFLIPADAKGIDRIDYDAIDGRILSDFIFTNVTLAVSDQLTGEVDASSAIMQAVDLAIIAQCAEALGGMDRAIELTAEYLKIRQQFGQPLANFQALQHGIANLFIEANDARSMVYRAMSKANASPTDRGRAVSACKVKMMEAARTVNGKAVHYHGGIGVTTEYSVGHYLRRALMLEQRFGNSAFHFERMMEMAYLP